MVISWLKKSQNNSFWAYMDQLLMGYVGGDIVLPGNIFKRLSGISYQWAMKVENFIPISLLKKSQKYSFFGLHGSVIDGLYRWRYFFAYIF